MIAVLQWVHDNIRPFGGDPDRVILTGDGVGAEFVNLLHTSPLAKGKENHISRKNVYLYAYFWSHGSMYLDSWSFSIAVGDSNH